jgi:hypothetical protein
MLDTSRSTTLPAHSWPADGNSGLHLLDGGLRRHKSGSGSLRRQRSKNLQLGELKRRHTAREKGVDDLNQELKLKQWGIQQSTNSIPSRTTGAAG